MPTETVTNCSVLRVNLTRETHLESELSALKLQHAKEMRHSQEVSEMAEQRAKDTEARLRDLASKAQPVESIGIHEQVE